MTAASKTAASSIMLAPQPAAEDRSKRERALGEADTAAGTAYTASSPPDTGSSQHIAAEDRSKRAEATGEPHTKAAKKEANNEEPPLNPEGNRGNSQTQPHAQDTTSIDHRIKQLTMPSAGRCMPLRKGR